MRTWAFVMQKGGSGKSTIATQIAVYSQEQGERPLIVDLDPQRSAVTWSGLRAGRVPEAVPSLPSKLGDVIKQAGQMFHKTMIFVDTAPHTDSGALEAIQLADVVICPTKIGVLDLASFRETVALLEHSGMREKALVVINDITSGKGAAEDYARAVNGLREFGVRVCTTFLCHRKAYVTAVDRGSGVTELMPRDKAADEIRALWDEVHLLQPSNKADKEKV